MQINTQKPLVLKVRMRDNSLLTLGVLVQDASDVTGTTLVEGVQLPAEYTHTLLGEALWQLDLQPAVSRLGLQIPADANYPVGSVQCADCGGTGRGQLKSDSTFADASNMVAELCGCVTCNAKGWLPAKHPKGRKCEHAECKVILAPNWVPVYCSNECALNDA